MAKKKAVKSKKVAKITGADISELRRSLALHQTELAKKLKITSRSLTRIETGTGEPSAATMQRIEKFFAQNKNAKKIRELSPKQLIALRKKTGLSQNAFGRKMGVTHTAIRNYENGWSRPALKIMQRFNKLAESL